MRQSQLFTKTTKATPQEEPSANAQFLQRAGFVDRLIAGVYTILPLGKRVLAHIEQIIREEMEGIGGQEITMPALHPKHLWEATGRWKDMQTILYTLKDEGGHEYALGPTHEEVITPLMTKHIHSWRDLPRALFQFQVKFRKELRPKSGLLRGREFLMKDMYSFHRDEADLNTYYERAQTAYQRIFERVGLGPHTCITFASGGAFSQYSHEYQTITTSGEDTIFVCSDCQQAVNAEIKDTIAACPHCGADGFTEQKAIEVGNIFKLGTKFSNVFHLHYTDEHGELKPVVMGCYGIGLGRLLGAIVEVHHDTRGIIWPESVSPFDVHLLNLNKNSVQSDNIYATLQNADIQVLYDDRSVSHGVKLSDADLIGITRRLVVSEKTGKKIEYRHRAQTESNLVTVEEFINKHA